MQLCAGCHCYERMHRQAQHCHATVSCWRRLALAPGMLQKVRCLTNSGWVRTRETHFNKFRADCMPRTLACNKHVCACFRSKRAHRSQRTISCKADFKHKLTCMPVHPRHSPSAYMSLIQMPGASVRNRETQKAIGQCRHCTILNVRERGGRRRPPPVAPQLPRTARCLRSPPRPFRHICWL